MLLLIWGCGGSPSGAHDAAATDSPAPEDAASDAEILDGGQEDALRIVTAWLARTLRIELQYDYTYHLADTMAQLIRDEATASPRPERRVMVLRVEDVADGGGRITVGVAEGSGNGGSPPYRFVADPRPATVATAHFVGDGGLHDYPSGFLETFLVALPIPPNGGHDAQLLRLTAGGIGASINPGEGVWLGGGAIAHVTVEDACHVWIGDINLLDELDLPPTGPGDAGSVDYATCTPNPSYPGPTYSVIVHVDEADRTDLLVRE
ncbi:MAG: hypothetical protein HY906_04485 [Deltaproteobacteria bacterium]|nr:hypothetical protein [Deltaproteobacteria bacterium]